MTNIGERLKHLLMNKGVNQSELAKLVGYSPASVTAWIRGRSEPNLNVIQKICQEFNCSADWLLGLSSNLSGNSIEFEHEGIRWIENVPEWLDRTQQDDIKETIQIFRGFIMHNLQRQDLMSLTMPIRDSADIFQAAFRIGALRITQVPRDTALEDKLKQVYKLHEVIVAGISEDIDGTPPRVEMVTFLAATQAIKTVRNPIAVGVGAGHTMLRFAEQSVPYVPYFRGTQWLPLMSMCKNNFGRLSANAIAILMSQRHAGTEAYQIPFLHLEHEEDIPNNNEITQRLKQATAIFYSVNGIGRALNHRGEHLDFVEEFRTANYEMALEPLSGMYQRLVELNRHQDFGGELLGRMMDKEGQPFPELETEQRKHYQSVDLRLIRDLTSYGALVWIIATRRYKADAVLMAIQNGLANSLVIDREIAWYLLEQK